MFNGNTGGSGEFEHEVNGYKGPPVTRITLETYELDKQGFIGGGGYDFRYPFGPALAMLNLPPDGPQWGAEFKATMRRMHTRTVYCWGHATQMPVVV